MAPPELRILALPVLGEITPGVDLAGLVLSSVAGIGEEFHDGDVLVVTQKAVSKAEGRVVKLDDYEPSDFARRYASAHEKDPRHVEVVLQESRRIVKMDRGVLISETRHGFICANAGVDASNVGSGVVCLLPVDPDASAGALRDALGQRTGVRPAVIVTDTFGRVWRNGLTNVAIGVAGMAPLQSYAGQQDPYGYELRVTVVAVADEIAGASELVMGKTDGVPFALVRGFPYEARAGAATELVREPSLDLFR